MPNAGFLGTEVRIQELTIRGGAGDTAVVSAVVQFCSEAGVVHGMAKHDFALDPAIAEDDGLSVMARDLLAKLVTRVSALHFRQPAGAGAAVIRGITESMRASTPDEPGTQG